MMMREHTVVHVIMDMLEMAGTAKKVRALVKALFFVQ